MTPEIAERGKVFVKATVAVKRAMINLLRAQTIGRHDEAPKGR